MLLIFLNIVKIKTSVDGGDESEFVSDESIGFDLATLRDATNYFSEENKLGASGFDVIYKIGDNGLLKWNVTSTVQEKI